MQVARERDRIQSDCRFYGAQLDARRAERTLNPDADIHRQLQSSFRHEQCDFPRRDGRYANPVRACLIVDASLGIWTELKRTVDQQTNTWVSRTIT